MVTRNVCECLASILTVISMTMMTAKALDWKDCGGSKITFDSIELDPLPLKFESTVSVSGKFHVSSTINSLSDVTELDKKVLLFWPSQLKDCPNHIGTCNEKDFCAVLEEFPALCDNGLPCSCPIEAKSYEFKTTVNTPKNDYGWLGTGDFYYKISLEEEGEQVGCLEVYFAMDRKRQLFMI